MNELLLNDGEPIAGPIAAGATGPDAAPPLLEIEELRTHFFTASGIVRAVDGVSYTVRAGETLGVVGESGCGKSVTALSILRLVADPPGRIVGGAIRFAGTNLLDLSESAMEDIRGNAISMIFQEPMTSLNPLMTIGRQISEAVVLHQRVSRREARERTIEALRRVHIPEPERRIHAYPHQLSGGMRQRAMIAMALSCNPKLLIADEPTTALDVTIQAQILDLMRELQQTLGHRDHPDYARHGSRRRERRPRRRHVCRAQGRGGGGRRFVRLPRTSLYARAARLVAEPRKGGARRCEAGSAQRDQGNGAVAGAIAAGMQFCAALRLRDRAVPRRLSAARTAPPRPLGRLLARRPLASSPAG